MHGSAQGDDIVSFLEQHGAATRADLEQKMKPKAHKDNINRMLGHMLRGKMGTTGTLPCAVTVGMIGGTGPARAGAAFFIDTVLDGRRAGTIHHPALWICVLARR